MQAKGNPKAYSDKEREEAIAIFKRLDKNNDGKLSDQELRHGLKELKLPSNDAVVNDLIKKIDTDKNGEMSQSVILLSGFGNPSGIYRFCC